MRLPIVLVVLAGLAGCGSTPAVPDNSLARIACPEARSPADDSFGATTVAYLSLVEQYKKCRAAVLRR